MGLHRAWYAPVFPGVYRMTEAGFGPTARCTNRITPPVGAERRSAPHAVPRYSQQTAGPVLHGLRQASPPACPLAEGAR
ncbi:hypothetical protein ACIHCQ_38195 [Streptomyces sp. NPDC052236]|uniref:hypothetical protein n=1 Tax=Streptomyces sp. NPDC052236 TaxID=3365686 RepID=UPI0037D2F749